MILIRSLAAAVLLLLAGAAARADQPVDLPCWVGREVTDDMAYRNSELSRRKGSERAASDPAEAAPAR